MIYNKHVPLLAFAVTNDFVNAEQEYDDIIYGHDNENPQGSTPLHFRYWPEIRSRVTIWNAKANSTTNTQAYRLRAVSVFLCKVTARENKAPERRSREPRETRASVIVTSWFAVALDEIRTRRILREKADCKQSTRNTPRISQFIIDSVHFMNQNSRWILPYICLMGGG